MNWRYRIKLRDLLTEDESYENVKATGIELAKRLRGSVGFKDFAPRFLVALENIPQGDEIVTACDRFNSIMNKVYDFADNNSIWID